MQLVLSLASSLKIDYSTRNLAYAAFSLSLSASPSSLSLLLLALGASERKSVSNITLKKLRPWPHLDKTVMMWSTLDTWLGEGPR